MRAQPLAFAILEFGGRAGTRKISLDSALILLVGMTTIGQVSGPQGGENEIYVVHDAGLATALGAATDRY